MMNKRILLIGGGGHCKSVLDSLLEVNEYIEIGIVDKKENLGKSVMSVPVVDVMMIYLLYLEMVTGMPLSQLGV